MSSAGCQPETIMDDDMFYVTNNVEPLQQPVQSTPLRVVVDDSDIGASSSSLRGSQSRIDRSVFTHDEYLGRVAPTQIKSTIRLSSTAS